MSNRTDGEAASELQSIEKKITGEGCSSVDELISQLHESNANREKAEQARDKLAKANNEAAKIIGGKGTQLGKLNQQLAESQEKVTDLETKLAEALKTEPGEPNAPQRPVPPEKSVEEELAEVEASLTEEQWEIANQLIAVEEEGAAIALAESPKARVAFLNELVANSETKTRPTAFPRSKKKKEESPPDAETQVQKLMKRLSGVTMGPSGRVAGGGGGKTRPTEKQPDPRLH